jgi:hypothetical protein
LVETLIDLPLLDSQIYSTLREDIGVAENIVEALIAVIAEDRPNVRFIKGWIALKPETITTHRRPIQSRRRVERTHFTPWAISTTSKPRNNGTV